MEANFWHERWAKNEIAFHEREFNILLTSHFHRLNLAAGSRVLVPLCGKTRDIAWLLGQGFRVVGAELSELAVQQLFVDLGVAPNVQQVANLKHYHAEGIEVFAGNIFELTSQLVGKVDAIYDRAALVALPADMRKRYAAHLCTITGNAPQELICFEYDQSLQAGPPFSVVASEVSALYSKAYELQLVETKPVAGGLKGKCAADEQVWILKPKASAANKS